MKQVVIGGIIRRHLNKIGMDFGFDTAEEAQFYKHRFIAILEQDNYIIKNRKGYYENKSE